MLEPLHQDVLFATFSFLTQEDLAVLRRSCKALNVSASSERAMMPFLNRLRNIDKNVNVLAPQGAKSTWCYERFTSELKRIAEAQADEITHFLVNARTLPNTPAVQHELAQLRALNNTSDKNKIKLTALEEADGVLERLNAALIESKVNLNSDRLNLFKMGLTRFPQSVFNKPKYENYCKNLKIIECSHNALPTLPELGIFPILKDLSCANNKLIALPDLSNCPLLERIYCGNNKLTVLPNLSNLRNLQTLSCHHNNLTALPKLKNCHVLQRLYCYNNDLTALPKLSNCQALRDLACYNNKISDLPDFSNCQALQDLSCYNNEISDLPDLSNCQALQSLDCYQNYLIHLSNNLINKMGKKWAQDALGSQKILPPSLITKLTTFSAFPRLCSSVFSAIASAILLSITGSWLTLIAGIAAGLCLHTFLKRRSAFYNKRIIQQKSVISELPDEKQKAFYAGQHAANSINCYLVSFLKKNAWRHFDTFGAGMQNELNRRINAANRKNATR